jgi:hypothetical protein
MALAERGLSVHLASVGRFLHCEGKSSKERFCPPSSCGQSSSAGAALRCEKTKRNFAAIVALAAGFILVKSVHTA